MSLAFTMTLYLALQGMIALAATEVFLRYGRWYVATAKSEGLLLRFLIFGIAFTHGAIAAEHLSWMYERLFNVVYMDSMSERLVAGYQRAVLFKIALFLGIIFHMVPIWKIVHRYTYGEVLLALVARVGIAAVSYLLGLYVSGALDCYVSAGCSYAR